MRHASTGVPHFLLTLAEARCLRHNLDQKRLGFFDAKPNPLVDAQDKDHLHARPGNATDRDIAPANSKRN
jgi:hypothetical protein